jgi:hypothetical protein
VHDCLLAAQSLCFPPLLVRLLLSSLLFPSSSASSKAEKQPIRYTTCSSVMIKASLNEGTLADLQNWKCVRLVLFVDEDNVVGNTKV